MSLGKLLKKLAILLHRPNAERPTQDWFKISLILICALPFLSVYGLPVLQIIQEWRALKLEVRIPAHDWKVLYNPASPTVASPQNPELWQSTFSRDNPKHAEFLKQTIGREFWVGAVISVDQLRSALEKHANVFILGRIGGSFNLWVDGKEYLSGSRKDANPIEVALPLERLKKPEPLHIAVEIFNDAHHPYPDYFNGYSIGEGLATRTQYSLFANYDRFISGTRMYGLMLLNFSFAMFFLSLWRSSPIKQEYFYIGFYSLLNCFVQLRSIEQVFSRLPPEANILTDIVLNFLIGGFAMLLGLSYSRLRGKLLKAITAFVFIPPVAAYFLTSSINALFSLNEWITGRYTPFCCAIGAVACLLQSWYLREQKGRGLFLPLRMRRLVYFAAGLLVIALINYLQSSGIVSKFQLTHLYRLSHFALLGFLGRIVFREYKDQNLLVEKTPVSEYHRRPELPAQIWGVLLVADLKSSEFFYRHRAEKNPTGDSNQNIVSLWRSHFGTTVLKYGGTVLGQKGDEILVFFEQQNEKPPELLALECAQEMVTSSKLLEQALKDKGAYPPGAPPLMFRSAMTTGAIRPIWEELGGGERIPYWEEAAHTTPFVTLSRILEFEKTVPESKEKFLLVLDELLTQKLFSLGGITPSQRLYAGLEKQDKHSRLYKVNILCLEKTTHALDINNKKIS